MGRMRSTLSPNTRPNTRARGPRMSTVLVLGVIVALVAISCGGEAASSPTVSSSPLASGTPGATNAPGPSIEAVASGDVVIGPCTHVIDVGDRLAGLGEVELKLPNRVTLDIELSKVQAAFAELRQADLGPLEAQLEDPLRRLGYRLIDLEIAVEDFRTNARPRRAAAHVEEDSKAFADAIAGFTILARC